MIQIHRLEGFFHVAKAGGYTRAARGFPYPITQPGVHLQVRRLEEDLGVRLFDRVGRDRVELTAQGRRLFEFAAPFFEGLTRVAESLLSGEFAGTLRVESSALEIRHVLPKWLRRLRTMRPDISVEVLEVAAVEPERLLVGETDLIVEVLPRVPQGIGVREIARHYTFLVVPASMQKRGEVHIESLRDEPLVTFHPSLPQAAMQLAAISAHFQPKKVVSASSTESILGFVAAGLGYSLIPWPSETGPRFPGVRAVRMKGEGTEFPIVVAWKKRKTPDPLVDAALSALAH